MSSRLSKIAFLVASCALAACDSATDTSDDGASPGAAVNGVRYLSGATSTGFERALAPITLEFPRDHGAHPEYATEWWYFTGNLFDDNARHFGFELTLFRIGLRADAPEYPSAWASSALWMAHLAVTDTARGRFLAEERLSRDGLDLAGATASPFRVWVEDWSVEGTSFSSLRLRASGDEIAVALDLEGLDRIVLQGDAGLDPKGPEPGNASYYYSAPRLATTGTIRIGEADPIEVDGLAWMDREWGTSALSPGVEGWDWFAVQLDDGRNLMYYRLRESDGGTAAASGGTLSDETGLIRRLLPGDVNLAATDFWRSDVSGILYPITWQLDVPDEGLELTVEPYLESQELNLTVRYWEGAVHVRGTANGEPIGGNGYLELAGY